VVVAVTKMDKMTRNQRLPALRAAEKALGLPRDEAIPFSAVEGTGSEALWERIAAMAGVEPEG
jgi:GTP-binding protein